MDRRDFLNLTATSATGLLLSSLDTIASAHNPTLTMNKNFELKILATNWGFHGTQDEFLGKVKKEGYDGIEIWWQTDKDKQNELFAGLKKYQLEVGFLCAGSQTNWKEHLDLFKSMTTAAATNTIQQPLYINCHSGRDHFSFEQNKAFIDHTVELSKRTGVIICHETHRSRILYAAPVARQFMEKIPDLRMTLDVSHWCNVHESLLQDQQETLDMTLERVDHIHARIGHPESPQVSDPRAPEWEDAVKAHLNWWDKIVERKRKRNERLTILTEFGPPDYMPSLPYTRQPLADQWAINVHMLGLLRKRYGG